MIREVSSKLVPLQTRANARVPYCQRCGWQGPICDYDRAEKLSRDHECEGAVL